MVKTFFKKHYVIIFILFFAAVIRLLNIGFQTGSHPDERGIVMISLDVAKNGFNPKNFHYGHFVYYLLYFSSEGFKYLYQVFPKIELFNFLSSYDGAFYIGRVYAVIASLITIFFTYLLSTNLFNKKVGLLSAFFIATNPFFISLSRYYTTDIFVTCFIMMSGYYVWMSYKCDSYKNYLISVFLASIGLVCKISAAIGLIPIFFIFILFLFQHKNYKSFKFYSLYIFIPLIVSLATIFICEPFLFFDFSSFLRDNTSQLDMIKGKWMPPYTRQYLGTVPIVYHLTQMFFYTIRPVVFILSLLGIIGLCCKKDINKIVKIFLLLFFLPCFITSSLNFVKFPRYLLVIYPVLMVFAALGINFIKSLSLRKVVCIVSIVVSLIISIDCILIYFKEHSYVTASRWIYKNVPKNSTILNPHWDDVVPVHLPGIDTRSYSYKYHEAAQSLNLYEESNEKNLENFATTLMQGDYIVFPADRMFRGILDKFDQRREYSVKILSSLFDGSLGYVKAYVYKPKSFLSKLGLYNDDLADESLTGYDHPKIFIFKKTRQLSLEDLKNQIKKPNNNKILNEVLSTPNYNSKNSDGNNNKTVNTEGSFWSSIWYMILWLIAIDLMSLYIIPVIMLACKNFEDKAYGIFRVIGIIVFAFFVWILGSVFGVSLTRLNLILVLLFLYLLSFYFIVYNHLKLSDFKFLLSKNILKIECYYIAIFLVFAIFKFLSPEIVWGEKTMDLGFLNYFIRVDSLPCNDPWSIDNKLSYYFFGYFILGLIHKIFSIPSEYGFNLSIITIASLIATTLSTLFFYLKRSINFSIFASFCILMLSNFEKFYMYFFDTKKTWKFGFDLFWKTSRVHEFYSNAISEYPFWSIIFSDLHPHLMAMPIFACMVLWFTYIYKEKELHKSIYIIFPINAVVLCMTNTWDVFTVCAFSVIFVLLLFAVDLKKACRIINSFVILGIISLVFFLPFYFFNLSSSESHIGWVQTLEFHRLHHVFRHFGFWIFPIIVSFLVRLKENFKGLSLLKGIMLVFFSSIPCVLGAFSKFGDISWGIQIFCSFLIFISLYELNERNFIKSTCLMTFALLLSFTELCFIIDRPNTIFKFYIGMWFLIGIASIISLSDIIKFKSLKIVYSILFLICFLSSAISYVCMSRHTHIGDEKVKYTLNGIEFLKSKYEDRLNVVSYINSHIFGIPVLMENYGPSYHTNTSIPYQKYTGLPIIHGWDHHIFQRGTSRENMTQKKKDIRTFYKTLSKEKTIEIVNKYNIDLVVVGEKELEQYDILSKNKPNKFDDFKDIFTLLYSSNNESLYVVNSRLNKFYLYK